MPRLWSPSDLTNLFAWFDAADIAQSDGTDVNTWTDKSGNSRNLTKFPGGSGSGSPPTYSTSNLASLPAVVFDGTQGMIGPTTSPDPFDFEADDVMIHVVFKTDGDAVVGTVLTNNSRLDGYAIWRSEVGGLFNFTLVQAGPSTFTAVDSTTIATNGIMVGYENLSGTNRGYVNGANTLSGTPDGSVATGTPLQVGYSGSTTSLPTNAAYKGSISEIIFHQSNTTATRQLVEGYTAHKYGLATQLPATHPYKNAAPTVDDIVWTNGSGNNNLGTASNWSGGVVPGAKDKVLFFEGSGSITTGSLTAKKVYVAPGFGANIGTSSSPVTFTAETVVLGTDDAEMNVQLANNTQTFVTNSTNGVKLSGSGTNIFLRSKEPTTLALTNNNTMTIDARHPSGSGGLVSHESGNPLLTRTGFGGLLEHSFAGGLDTVEITGNGQYRHTEGSMPSFFLRGGEAVFDGTLLSGVSDLLGGVLTLRDSSQPLIEFGVIRLFPGGTIDLTGSAVGQVDFTGSKVISSRGGGKLRLGQGRTVAMS